MTHPTPADRTPPDPDRACEHADFTADVTVNRIGTAETTDGHPRAYHADIRVRCANPTCNEPFRWTGAPRGLSYNHPTTSLDQTELRAPLRPATSDPDFGLGLPSFSINLPT